MPLQDGFGLKHVDGGHTGPAPIERCQQGIRLQNLGARCVDQQRCGLHAGEVFQRDAAGALFSESQMQAQHIRHLEQRLTAGGELVAVGRGLCLGGLAAPDDHAHSEGSAIGRDQFADAAVAPDAQHFATQHHAQAKVGGHRCRLQPGLLPCTVFEAGHVLRNPAHGRHDQRPGQFGGGDR
ncbi:hypothetical protein D9M68_844990 [compost metagenome]